jgi:hypothetical protein
MIIIQAQPVFEVSKISLQEKITKEVEDKNITLQSNQQKSRQEEDIKIENIKPPLKPEENKGKIIDVTG